MPETKEKEQNTQEEARGVAFDEEKVAAMIGEAVRQSLDAQAPKQEKEDKSRKLNPDADTEGADVEVKGDRAQPWERRTVRYFNALATTRDSQAEGFEMLRSLQREVAQMPARQRLDENREAAQVIDESNLSKHRKRALKAALEISTRLHTTSTSDTPKAGYLLPKPFLAEMFVIIEQYGVVRSNFRMIPMTSKDIDLKNVSTKVVAGWTDEGANITADDLVFAEGQLAVKKLAGLTNWTTELEEDMAISLLPIVQEIFAESIAEEEDKAGLLGDGTATYGSFTGLLNLSGAQAETLAAGETTADNLGEDNIRAARDLLSEARQQGAVWIMHRTVRTHIAKFESTGGDRIFQENIRQGEPDTLLGFPVITSEVMPSLSSVGADEPFIVFGNPRRALMGQRRGVTADISREGIVQDGGGNIVYNAFQADGAILRITERVGFKVPSAYEDAFAVVKTAAS